MNDNDINWIKITFIDGSMKEIDCVEDFYYMNEIRAYIVKEGPNPVVCKKLIIPLDKVMSFYISYKSET